MPKRRLPPIERSSRWRKKPLRFIRWGAAIIASAVVLFLVVKHFAENFDDEGPELVMNDDPPDLKHHEPKKDVAFDGPLSGK